MAPHRNSRPVMHVLASFAVLALLVGVAVLPWTARGAEPSPPILFVHGNGDSAALWTATVWRFESNGYDPARLFAMDFTRPSASISRALPTAKPIRQPAIE